MSGSHAHLHDLYHAGTSPLHRLAPEAKVVALVVFVVTVAVTPRDAPLAFAGFAAVLLGAFAIARLPVRLLGRVRVVAPFVAVALVLPFVAHGPRRDVLGVAMSVDGARAGGAIAARSVLGALSAVVLTATTPLRSILTGLDRLRVPVVVVAMIGLLFRYLDILVDEIRRMRRAMTARGHDPRWLWQARPIASSLGVLFVRAYERGERVHLAFAPAATWSVPAPEAEAA